MKVIRWLLGLFSYRGGSVPVLREAWDPPRQSYPEDGTREQQIAWWTEHRQFYLRHNMTKTAQMCLEVITRLSKPTVWEKLGGYSGPVSSRNTTGR